MEEQELKTSVKQRVVIAIIAVILVGSFIASYAAIVIAGSSNGGSSATSSLSEEKMMAYEEEYAEAVSAFKEGTAGDFAVFAPYLSEIRGYNEETANAGLATRDLLTGSGRELTDGDTDYLAYYVGFCADETIFDSSLDSNSAPTAFAGALDVTGLSLIAGWDAGVVGMRLGGVREITIPGELAYGETREICGGTNKPLKFIVMAVENTETRKALTEAVNLASVKLQYAQYGIDYDELLAGEEASE